MSRVVVFTTGGSLREMRNEFQRLQRPPIGTIVRLEKELASTFKDTDAVVHVITGSLKLSGRTTSDFDGRAWEGTITYGGPSAGVNNPVDYAIYEMARGGDHDFLRPTVWHEAAFEEIINDFFTGGDHR